MYSIAFFGALMIAMSVVMVVNPAFGGRAIVRFTRMPYMHPFEILTRIGFGLLFVANADQTQFPTTITVVGYLLLAVGAGLLLTPPSYHKRFAIWSVEKFERTFRPAGLVSLAFGIFLVYAAVQGPAGA